MRSNTTVLLQFLQVPAYRNVTLKCMTEIGGLNVSDEYNTQNYEMFKMVMSSIVRMIPLSTGMCVLYKNIVKTTRLGADDHIRLPQT